MKERLKSKVVWAAVLAQTLLIIGIYLPDVASEVKVAGAAVIEILTLFGILNNPTDKEKF